ncbi:hypothetical protein JVX98_13250 [Ensifer sp. PDNC004]|uniref:hypothetical protein n=1 Tax=Ensifer sp. PDNC004 TaxID=2811423 RepID=UPI001963627C|nr:hypothetical protein [Ensifer sp. PDNC004]QRY69181.1 hypothetical protein JVX98_13250 [Ensifer sp. PDNC004]
MNKEDKQAAARVLMDMPLVAALLDELEAAAVNGCINAPLKDDEARAAFAAEARAVRNFRSKIQFLSQDQSSADGKGAPA